MTPYLTPYLTPTWRPSMQEGDRGDEMYFVEAGEFAVLKRDDGGLNQEVLSTPAAHPLSRARPHALSICAALPSARARNIAR